MFKPNRNSINLLKKPNSILGVSGEKWIRVFFFGNAWIAILVLLLIAFFLFREGAAFFGMHRENHTLYRKSGLEYVESIKAALADHQSLYKFVNDAWIEELNRLQDDGLTYQEAFEKTQPIQAFADQILEASFPLSDLSQELTDLVTFARDTYMSNENMRQYRDTLLKIGEVEEANSIQIDPVDFEIVEEYLREQTPLFRATADTLRDSIRESGLAFPADQLQDGELRKSEWIDRAAKFSTQLDRHYLAIVRWDPDRRIGWFQSFSAFALGKRWITNSFWQDWFGILPLLTGSLLVSGIALTIAVPVGVMAAVYVNQLATSTEQRWIKPSIEFISAVPSVVLGFFGIAVLGEVIRHMSGWEWLQGIPFFPIAERLNAFTAGCLLAIMATPTIFTLAEDALNSVPKSYRNASYAVGATRLQTILHIVIPTALPGIISAILLGFGRVIGETMVVLLCAGNRIAIPEFSDGLGVIFEPVHTMTGIVAQEMGEVALGSIHYRALFMLGIVLFTITLTVNWIAQKIVRRFRIAMFTT
jgi:phosphate transport system permease protein